MKYASNFALKMKFLGLSRPLPYPSIPVVCCQDCSVFLYSLICGKPVAEIISAVPTIAVSVSDTTLLAIFCFNINTFFAVDCPANQIWHQFSILILCSFHIEVDNWNKWCRYSCTIHFWLHIPLNFLDPPSLVFSFGTCTWQRCMARST